MIVLTSFYDFLSCNFHLSTIICFQKTCINKGIVLSVSQVVKLVKVLTRHLMAISENQYKHLARLFNGLQQLWRSDKRLKYLLKRNYKALDVHEPITLTRPNLIGAVQKTFWLVPRSINSEPFQRTDISMQPLGPALIKIFKANNY